MNLFNTLLGNRLVSQQYSHWVKRSLNEINSAVFGIDFILQLCGGLLAALYGSQYVALNICLIWWLLGCGLSVLNYSVVRSRTSRFLSERDLDQAFVRHRVYRLLLGLLWSAPLLLLLQPDFALQDSLEILAVYFLVCIWASFTSLIRFSYLLMIAPILLVVTGALIAQQDALVVLVVLALYGFAAFMVRVTLVMRDAVMRYIKLDFQQNESHDLLKKQASSLGHLNKKITLNKQRLELLAENSTDIIAMHGRGGRNLYINHVATEITGYSIKELLAKHPLELTHPDDRDSVLRPLYSQALTTDKRLLGEYRVLHKDGHIVWIEVSLRRLPAVPGQPLRIVSVSRDITERHKVAAELATRQQTLETSLRSLRDAVVTLSHEGTVLYANSNARALFSLDNPLGHPILSLLSLRDPMGVMVRDFEGLVQKGQDVYSVSFDDQAGDREQVFDLSIGALKTPFSELQDTGPEQRYIAKSLQTGYVLLLRDITERRELEEELRRRAYTDSLTSVLNRAAFDEQLRTVHERMNRVGGSHALVLVDLDQFKVVNDTAGHHAGDELLVLIAETLVKSVREGDVVARLGGDEFALLLLDCAGLDAEHRTQQVCDAIANIHFEWGGKHYPVGASFGVAMLDDARDTVEVVMGRADSACYVVKDQGRNGVHLWSKDNADSGRQATDMDWVTRLQTAMNEQRIKIFGQHIWPLQADDPCQHLEVLISFRDVDGSLVSPVQFIPAAERYGLMPAIDHYVIEAVFRYIAPFQEQMSGATHQIAINLSGHTIGSDVALANIRKLFHHYAIKPELICFEITETAALQNMADAKRFLLALKAMGCHLALDDFGTGFSSFSYLKSLPVDIIKIDGEFVREMLHSPTDYAIVEAVYKVGTEMGLVTVAECIENGSLLKEVTALGVSYGQGHHLSDRQPLEQLLNKQTLAHAAMPKRSA